MSLDDLPRVVSGPGNQIYQKLFSPLLRESFQYDRVSSFYTANSLYRLLEELCEVWKRGGNVRLILGHEESKEIVPSLQIENVELETKKAVSLALEGHSGVIELISSPGSKSTRGS